MSNLAISVENMGKCYRIGGAAKQPESFRAAIGGFLGAPFHYLSRFELYDDGTVKMYQLL